MQLYYVKSPFGYWLTKKHRNKDLILVRNLSIKQVYWTEAYITSSLITSMIHLSDDPYNEYPELFI